VNEALGPKTVRAGREDARRQTAARVDAHHHVWKLQRGDYGWIVPSSRLRPLCRDFDIDEIRPLLEAAGIAATVLVQAAPTVAETAFLLDVALASDGLVKGVVGWVDLSGATAEALLRDLAKAPLLKSIRPMLQDLADPAWIVRADVAAAIDLLPALGLRLDVLATPRELPFVVQMAQRAPNLDFVVDHCAKPRIAEGVWQPWADDMAKVAQFSRAHCKLSGLLTEAGTSWNVALLAPYVDHVLECFGPARVMWGSDWPVVTLAAEYTTWTTATEQLLAGLTDDEREGIWGGNAMRFYGL